MQIHAVEKGNLLMMESAGLNYTHTHTLSHTCTHRPPRTHTAQYNTLQQGSGSSLIVNQELFHCNSCTL